MGAYLTPDELRDDPDVPDDLADPAANKLIAAAERRLDRLVGARAVYVDTGRKLKLADLDDWRAANVREATLLLAVAESKDANAFAVPTVGSTKGPDFEVSIPLQGREVPAAQAIREAAELLDVAGLRVKTARARA